MMLRHFYDGEVTNRNVFLMETFTLRYKQGRENQASPHAKHPYGNTITNECLNLFSDLSTKTLNIINPKLVITFGKNAFEAYRKENPCSEHYHFTTSPWDNFGYERGSKNALTRLSTHVRHPEAHFHANRRGKIPNTLDLLVIRLQVLLMRSSETKEDNVLRGWLRRVHHELLNTLPGNCFQGTMDPTEEEESIERYIRPGPLSVDGYNHSALTTPGFDVNLLLEELGAIQYPELERFLFESLKSFRPKLEPKRPAQLLSMVPDIGCMPSTMQERASVAQVPPMVPEWTTRSPGGNTGREPRDKQSRRYNRTSLRNGGERGEEGSKKAGNSVHS